MRSEKVTRRSTLQAGGTALLTSLAGCAALSQNEPPGVPLGDIAIVHNGDDPHTVRVELERDNELILEKTVEFSETRKEIIQATWSREPAVYTLYTAIQGTLDDTDDTFNIYVNQFDEPATEEDTCSIIRISLVGNPNPITQIGLQEPGLEGFGECQGPES